MGMPAQGLAKREMARGGVVDKAAHAAAILIFLTVHDATPRSDPLLSWDEGTVRHKGFLPELQIAGLRLG